MKQDQTPKPQNSQRNYKVHIPIISSQFVQSRACLSQNLISSFSNIPLNNKTVSIKRQKKPGSISSFIKKVWNMLEDNQYKHIVNWVQKKNSSKYSYHHQQTTSSFKIIDIKGFQQIVLPKYFKHSNLSSFIRQVLKFYIVKLNMYNFHKVRGEKGDLQFQNEKFVKDKIELLSQIRRKQTEAIDVVTNPLIQSQRDVNYSKPRLSEGNISLADELSEFNRQLCQNEAFSIKQEKIHAKQKQNYDNDDMKLEDSPSQYKCFQSQQAIRIRKMQYLNQQNSRLKQLKTQKQEKLKTLETLDKNLIQIKFSKVMFTIISQKLKQELTKNGTLTYKANQSQENTNKTLSTVQGIVQHILSEEKTLSFKNYKENMSKLLTQNNFNK